MRRPAPSFKQPFPGALALVASLWLGAAGCGSDNGGDEATFTEIQQTIFTPSCALTGCHNAITRQEGMVLEAGSAYDFIVGVRSRQDPTRFRIEAGFPERSYLLSKVRGQNIFGLQMPYNQLPLSADKIRMIEQWIAAGAPNN